MPSCVSELFTPAELIEMSVNAGFNANPPGLINLIVETPYGITHDPAWTCHDVKATGPLSPEMLEKIKQKLFDAQ